MKASIHCILIEDERPALEVLENYLQYYEELNLLAHFNNVFDAQDFMKSHSINLVFLDINLPGINGLEFLKGLKNKPLIVITSAYDEHAVEAFDLEVFDYLLKPYSLSRFNRTALRLMDYFFSKKDNPSIAEYIRIKSGTNQIRINAKQIQYIESQREYLVFYLDNKESVKSRMTIQEGLDLLDDQVFIQIHRSYIVNLKQVKSVSTKQLLVKDNYLPLGRLYRNGLLKKWESS